LYIDDNVLLKVFYCLNLLMLRLLVEEMRRIREEVWMEEVLVNEN
jgi:hypothetical protein